MIKTSIIAFFFLFLSGNGLCQTLQITDEKGNPLTEVTAVYQTETEQRMTYSDQDGVVKLSGIKEGSAVEFYRLGYVGMRRIWNSDLHFIRLEQKEFGLDEVVITAQYQPTKVSESVHAVRSISAEEIEKRAAVNLNDILRNELNFRVSQDNILGAQLAMQGISGENVKIMIDGVPVIGRLNGNIDLTQLNLNQIERMEIVEGPLAVNYGSNALAGTINLITKSAKANETEIEGAIFTESIGHFNATGSVRQGWQKSSLLISGGRNYFDGWSPEDDFLWHDRKPIADGRRVQQWNPREQFFADAKYRMMMTEGYFELAGSYFDEAIINRGAPDAAYGERAFDDHYHTARYGASAKLQLSLGDKWSTHHLLGYNIFRREKSTYVTDLTGVESSLSTNESLQDTSIFSNFLARGSFIGRVTNGLTLQLGYEAEAEESSGKRIVDETGRIDNLAAFFTAEWKPLDRLTLKPGLRAAYNSRYNAPIIPSVSALFQLPRNREIRGSYAQGFRATGLKELSFYFVDINHNIIGNANLDAERSHNVSASLRARADDDRPIGWHLSGFYNHIFNLITLAQVNQLEFSYINVGERQTTGGRAEVDYTLKNLNLSAGYALIGISNNLENDAASAFNFYSEATFRASYSFAKSGINANVFFKQNGRQTFLREDADGEVVEDIISAYQNLDFTLSKSFAESRIAVEIGARNLTDVQNINTTLSGGVHSGSQGSRAIGTGRTLFARLRINLNGKK